MFIFVFKTVKYYLKNLLMLVLLRMNYTMYKCVIKYFLLLSLNLKLKSLINNYWILILC